MRWLQENVDPVIARNVPVGRDAVRARKLRGKHLRTRIWIQAGAAGTVLVQRVDSGSNDFPMKKTPGKGLAVKATTLRWWRTQIRREHRPPPMLLPVVVRATADRVRGPAPSATETVEIAVGGMVIRAGVGCDVRYVAELARALQPAC